MSNEITERRFPFGTIFHNGKRTLYSYHYFNLAYIIFISVQTRDVLVFVKQLFKAFTKFHRKITVSIICERLISNMFTTDVQESLGNDIMESSIL